MAAALMMRAAAGACTALASGPAPRVATPVGAVPVRRSVAARAATKLDKPNRLWELDTTWYPGAEPAPHLDATLAGDRGFDPLGLGANPDTLPWLVEAELYNGRVAMMAVVGILFTEFVGLGPWWTAPFRADYPLPYWPGVIVSHMAMAVFEGKRVANFQKHGQTGLLNMAPFDPLGLRDDYRRQSEVRNGRLAMLAFLGFMSQAAVTGKAPLQNLADHLADPVRNNICTSKVGTEVTLAVIAITLTPIIYEARRSLGGETKGGKDGFRPIPFL